MNNSHTRRSVTQTENSSSSKYRELATKDPGKEMAKSKCAQNDGGISFTVSKAKSNLTNKRCAPLGKPSKHEICAKDSGTAKLNPRQKKQRQRCTANAKSTRQLRRNERERGRKARLNAAFQVLTSVVPNNIAAAGSTERKMTQVEILRLAKNYISNLTDILQKNSDNYSFNSYRFGSH